ncbi:hypothetical protein ABDK00_016895 [Niabella insulamsoli]|uniref:hypothetical protein n=1 Tax=Niabella insulamsoli TaxID=3144874 RepID=UPI0031FBD4AD
MENVIKGADISAEQVKKWKQQYGLLGKFKVIEGGVEKITFVRKPTNKEIDFASANLTRGMLTQYGITLFNTCKIGGDDITTEEGLRTVGQRMNEMIEAAEVEFEKI